MNRTIEERLTDLEDSIRKIHDRLDEHYFRDKTCHELHKLHGEQFSRLQLSAHKYDEVYYKIFPERLAADLKILDQFDEIKSEAARANKGQG